MDAGTLSTILLDLSKRVFDSHSKQPFGRRKEPIVTYTSQPFEYTERGVGQHTGTYQLEEREDYFLAGHIVYKQLHSEGIISEILSKIKATYPEVTEFHLERLVSLVTHSTLKNGLIDPVTCKKYADTFIADITNSKVSSSVIAEISGLAVGELAITLAPGVTLRRPTIDDLSYEFHALIPNQVAPVFSTPDSILEIQAEVTYASELQKMVAKAIAVLRLAFHPGIEYIEYTMRSESIARFIGGTLHSNQGLLGCQGYFDSKIHHEEFLLVQELMQKIPENLYWIEGKPDFLSVAFGFYSDAALTRHKKMEASITYAIIGFESLFAHHSIEQQNTVTNRVSKLFSLLGYNPHELKSWFTDAYRVRNLFSHGSFMKEEDIKELIARRGSLNIIRDTLLQYLRRALLVSLLLGYSKNSLCEKLDHSLVDDGESAKLKAKIHSLPRVLFNPV